MESFGNIIKVQREKKGLLLRDVGLYIGVDIALISKFERGERKPTREHVSKFAKLFGLNKNELIVEWLSDKLVYEVADEALALKALQVAEEKVKYQISRSKK